MSESDGPVLLVVFDGWGYRPEARGNAIVAAETPNYDQLEEAYPHLVLEAAGEAVGLPAGTVGSGPAGFATLAAGRPVAQAQQLIGSAIDDGSFNANPVLREMIARLRDGDGRLHLVGLVSNGEVVSSEAHYFELLHLLAESGVAGEQVFIHAVLDGYDTPPRSGMNYLARFAAEMMRTGVGRVATLMGRNYALPGVSSWEPLERAYGAMVLGAGRLAPTAIQAIQSGYSRGEDDADLSPTVVLGTDGLPLGCVRPGDQVLCFCHQLRGIERLLRALADPAFDGFAREDWPAPRVIGLAGHRTLERLGCPVAFPAEPPRCTLSRELAAAGKRVALLCESAAADHLEPLQAGVGPETVSSFVLPSPPLHEIVERPERLARELTEQAVELLDQAAADLIVVDYTNADLAGHRGQPETARAAVEALDAVLPQLVRAARRAGASMLLTACYGNVEQLETPNSARPSPAHTANRVPLVVIDDRLKGYQFQGLEQAGLADLAPTVLAMLHLDICQHMTGIDLLAYLHPAAPEERGETGAAPVEIDAVEALGMAIVAEELARDYYTAAAAAATDLDAAALYRHLAAGEAERLRGLERRRALLAPGSDEPTAGRFDPAPRPSPGLSPLEVLDLAIKEELESYRILAELAARNLDPQGAVVLEQLANDELDFLERLQRLSEAEAIRLLSALPPAGRRAGKE